MRRGTSIGAGLVLAVVLGRATPGCSDAGFVCQGDESCAGLDGGQCEADGHCSIPDADCDSGRRYAAHSGASSGQCVSGEATGSSTTGSGSEGQPSSDDADGGTTPEPPNPTDPTDPTGDAMIEACDGQAVVEEPFTALPLDPARWLVMNDAGIAVNVLDGALRLSAVDATAAYAELGGAFVLPPSGSVGVELLAAPPKESPGEAYVVLTDFETSYVFFATGGQLQLVVENGFEPLEVASLPHDPVAHRWLRLVFDPGEDRLAWEAAPAVGEWERLEETELETGFDPEESFFILGAGVSDGPFSADPLAAFGHAFACAD